MSRSEKAARKPWRRAGVALLIVLAAGLWALFRSGHKPDKEQGPPPIPVAVTSAQRQDVPVQLQGLGNVQAYYSVTVHSRVDGQLDKVFFREGQDVKAGDVLAQIDPRTFQTALDQAIARKAQDQAQLANTQRDLERYRQLVQRQAVTQQLYDTTRSQVDQLQATVMSDEAAIENARVQLGYTTITSPIDGRVGIRQIDPGNIVHASDANGIVVITQMRPISLIFTLPENDLPEILDAMANGPLEVTALSGDGSRDLDTGRLELVDNTIDQASGTVRLKATMPNQKGLLWPGQFINARLLLEVRRGVVTVPASVVQRGQDGRFAYVVEGDGTVSARKVRVRKFVNGTAVVDEGIQPGEQVVSVGQYRLKPGARVAIQKADTVQPDQQTGAAGQ